MSPSDKILTTAGERLAKAAPGVIPWDVIIAALMNALSGCLNPSVNDLKAQFTASSMAVRVRVLRAMLAAGLRPQEAREALPAIMTTGAAASGEEWSLLIAAAKETA